MTYIWVSITTVYFKALYSPSVEVKDAAHDGLRLILANQTRLPRETLQAGLRPVLLNLADPKRLTGPHLEGLARLLELLTNYFKVEIGSKLLDHFRAVANREVLKAASYKALADNEEIAKLVGLVHIFHLLPAAANVFLKDLVDAVVDAESCLESSAPSPITEPLAKFLNRYPNEAVDYFLNHMGDTRHVRTFRNVLASRQAPLVEQELAGQTSRIVSVCFLGNDRSLILPGLLVFEDLASLCPDWLRNHSSIIYPLLDLWHTGLQNSSGTSLDPPGVHSRQIALMRDILIRALKQTPRIDLLFDIVAIYTCPSVVDVSSLTNLLYKHVAMSTSTFFRRNILLRFLSWFADTKPSWTHKTVFLRYIINPLLLVTFSRPDEYGQIMDPDTINQIHNLIWQSKTPLSVPTSDDALSIELLHLSTLLVHHCPNLIQEIRKDIIKWAWDYITVEDPMVKQTAYILAARFFEAFESPAKFILTTWAGLLRPPHTEGRALIRQALDILAPALPKRIHTEGNSYPSWAKLTRRILVEEGHGMSQLLVIYQLIIRHPTLFYSYRDLFVPHMVSSLPKLGLQSTATLDSRSLSLDLLDLIMDWEQQAKQMLSLDRSQTSLWTLPLNHRETIVSFLVRLVVTSNEPVNKAGLIMRALDMLQTLIGPNGWSEVTVKLNFFIRALDQVGRLV